MEHVKAEDLQQYISSPVLVRIRGGEGEEMPPWLPKSIQKIEPCPDHTHLRIYFDSHYFFAVPFDSEVTKTDKEWTAYDQNTGLYYAIKK